LPKAISFKLYGHGWCVQPGVILLFSFGWRYVSDGFRETSVVEPVYPFQRSELDRFEAPPWSKPMDDFSLVEKRRQISL
jgi:hypothetical protein